MLKCILLKFNIQAEIGKRLKRQGHVSTGLIYFFWKCTLAEYRLGYIISPWFSNVFFGNYAKKQFEADGWAIL